MTRELSSEQRKRLEDVCEVCGRDEGDLCDPCADDVRIQDEIDRDWIRRENMALSCSWRRSS